MIINGKHYDIIPEIEAFFEGTNILIGLEMLDVEHPFIFKQFIAYCWEYEGNEDILPETWKDFKEDFYEYMSQQTALIMEDVA